MLFFWGGGGVEQMVGAEFAGKPLSTALPSGLAAMPTEVYTPRLPLC